MEAHKINLKAKVTTHSPARRFPKGSNHGGWIKVNGQTLYRSNYDSERAYREAAKIQLDHLSSGASEHGRTNPSNEANGVGESYAELSHDQFEDIQAALS